MKTLKYKIKNINPLVISSKSGDKNMINTEVYIPGSSVLGVFASLYIKNKKLIEAHRDKIFYGWFLRGDLIFTNAYIFDEKRRYLPAPYSIKQEKYKSASAYDFMFADDNFNKTTKSINEFIALDDNYMYSKTVKKSISFHNAREGVMPKIGAIFNYESISEDQIFEGNIVGEDEQIERFREMFDKNITAYVGLSKNSQYGKVSIKLEEISDYASDIPTDVESDDEDVIMTLLSDAIIYNKNGFSTADATDLENWLGVKIKKSFIKSGRAEQFVGVWKLKNQSETVFAAGSCFELEKLPDNYKELQTRGIGEKTNEGFGRVVFGWQNKNKYTIDKKERDQYKKPEEKPPKAVKDIVAGIIQDRLKDKVVSKAIQDAHSFCNHLPTKSLCGKLQAISNDADNFQNNLKKITKNNIAKDQLEKCNDDHVKLLDYLNQNKFDISSMLNEIDNLDEFTNTLKHDNGLAIDMKRLYLKTFFNFMRKDERREK